MRNVLRLVSSKVGATIKSFKNNDWYYVYSQRRLIYHEKRSF
jgi:hypothetical protein